MFKRVVDKASPSPETPSKRRTLTTKRPKVYGFQPFEETFCNYSAGILFSPTSSLCRKLAGTLASSKVAPR